MKYEKRIRKNKAKYESEIESMNKVLGLSNLAKGRERFKDLNLMKRKKK